MGETMKWPRHKASLTLTHNQHKDYHLTVPEAIEAREPGYVEWVSDEQRQKAINTNDCWVLQWYPDTPIGSHVLAAADLDVLLDAASRDDK